jgi:hypothetical protein
MHGNHPQIARSRLTDQARHIRPEDATRREGAHTTNQNLDRTRGHPKPRVDWTTWWLWRGAYTRSHPELGREIPQRPWYCVLRHGRVGRRQVFQSTLSPSQNLYQRGVEQPGSSSGS